VQIKAPRLSPEFTRTLTKPPLAPSAAPLCSPPRQPKRRLGGWKAYQEEITQLGVYAKGGRFTVSGVKKRK
jgi:hypothetical protein